MFQDFFNNNNIIKNYINNFNFYDMEKIEKLYFLYLKNIIVILLIINTILMIMKKVIMMILKFVSN